jgi:hypothetical protein
MESRENPLLSIIVVIASDTTEPQANVSLLTGCLDALSHQVDQPPMEVIVPYHRRVIGIDRLRECFPQVDFVLVNDLKVRSRAGGSREHHDRLKSEALKKARGQIIGFLEDNEVPDLNWCAATVEAHKKDYAGVGGAIENKVDRLLNWAVYFCDFGRYQNPVIDGESAFASDANVSYKRSALEAVRPSWEEGLNEVTVNAALTNRGEKLALNSDMVVYQQRNGLRLSAALRERYVWGRSFGAVRCQVMGFPARLAFATVSPVLPGLVALKLAMTAWGKKRNFLKFVQAFPLVLLLLMGWGFGELLGYLTRRPA